MWDELQFQCHLLFVSPHRPHAIEKNKSPARSYKHLPVKFSEREECVSDLDFSRQKA